MNVMSEGRDLADVLSALRGLCGLRGLRGLEGGEGYASFAQGITLSVVLVKYRIMSSVTGDLNRILRALASDIVIQLTA